MPQNLNYEEQAEAALMVWAGEHPVEVRGEIERAWRKKGRTAMPSWFKEWPRIEEIADRVVDLLALGIKTERLMQGEQG